MKKEAFWDLYLGVFQKAKELTEDRMPEYVGTGAIVDYWINGIHDLVYEINKKTLRFKRQIARLQQSKTADGVKDTLIDLINYAAFAYAYLSLDQIGELSEMTEKSEISYADYKEGKTLAIDFDGVISHYDGWKGKGVFAEPVSGTKEALDFLLSKGWMIIVNTTRLEVDQIALYMKENQLPYMHINYNPVNQKQFLHPCKPLADIYLDDRAICFEGNWKTTLRQIEDFESWWKKARREKEEGERLLKEPYP